MTETSNTFIELHIEELGPIHDSRIVLKPFMVFSGESGTGKSYTALLVHYLYKILCEMEVAEFFKDLNASFDEQKAQLPDEGGVLLEFTLNQFEEWLNEKAVRYVAHMLGNYTLKGRIHVHFEGPKANYKFTYQKEVAEMNGEMMYFDTVTLNDLPPLRLPYRSSEWGNIPYHLLFNIYLKSFYQIHQRNTLLLPPSRGGLVCLTDTGRGNFQISQGGMYNEFISGLSNLKSATPFKDENAIGEYQTLSQSLIKGKINIKDNDLYYEQAFGEIPITAGAASVKELAPFAFMLQKGLVSDYSVMFEEPETNLHPELQIKVADTLAYLLQQGCRFQITTHSDYFLRRINDLIRLDILQHKLSKEKYQSLCDSHHYHPELTISPRLIGAYYFKRISETEVKIIVQEAGNGIPFDTFQSVLNHQLKDSSYIYDKMCELNGAAD